MVRRVVIALCLMLVMTGPVWALDPDEPLTDPVLETRARALSKELRCVVCQNQSIDESDADLAKAMRLLVRKRLTAGDSDGEIVQALQDRYGDSIRLMPPFKASTYVLWAAPFAFLALGLWGWRRTLRRADVPRVVMQPDAEVAASGNSSAHAPSWQAMLVACVVILALSTGVYALLGHPKLPDQPFAPRLAEKLGVSEQAIADMQAMADQLAVRLEQTPTDGQAWLMLGRANRYLDRHGEAAIALKRAIAYGVDQAPVYADLGESLVLQEGGMTAEAKQAFVRALLRDATEPRAAWFMAMSAVQDGKLIAAIGILKQAAAAQPETSVWRQRLSVQAVRIQEQLKVLP